MDKKHQDELLRIVDKYSDKDGINETSIAGVSIFKASSVAAPLPTVYTPCLCIIAQGHKQVSLEKETYDYGASQYLIVSVDLPVVSQITVASKENPYFVLKIDIDLQQISELLIHTNYSLESNTKTSRALFVGDVNEAMGESIVRLARLLETPQDIPILAGQMTREVLYRVLCSDYREQISLIASRGSHMNRIANAIRKLKTSFHELITVEELAELAGMSVSSFHAHFKSVTAMSPLQYQKTLRLIEARTIMFANNKDAMSTAYQVGYESPTQFNREYARMFGNPPMRDIALLKEKQRIAV